MLNEPNDENSILLRLNSFNLGPATEEVEDSEPLMCTVKNWADIIYLTGTGDFWLLTEKMAESLHSAAEELSEWASIEDHEQRFEKLSDEAGLLECFLAVRPENFLDEGERQLAYEKLNRLSELLNENRQEEDDEIDAAESVREYQPLLENAWYWVNPVAVSANYAWNRFRRPEETRLISELNELYKEGERRAKEGGYTIEGDNYYGAWEKEIQEAIETYRQCRSKVIKDQVSVDNPGGTLSIREALKEYSEFLADCESMSPVDSSRCDVIKTYFLEKEEELSNDVRAYEDSILALAAMGIATPEWALADVTMPSTDAQAPQESENAFNTYNKVLKKAVDILDSVERKLSDWATATARNTALPLQLFEGERRDFKELTDQLDTLYALAESSVEQMTPKRVLFWQSDVDDPRYALGYERQQTNTLVRSDFPLREFSSPVLDRALSHISMKNLMKDMTEGERHIVQQCLESDGVLPATLWESRETALSYWFQQRGCKRISAKSEWFEDGIGSFIPEALFSYLSSDPSEQNHVESLADAGAKERWGKNLQRILFTGPGKQKLRLFDASAQAQMFRLVSMSSAELNEALDIDDPLALMSSSATLEFFKDSSSGGIEGENSLRSSSRQGGTEDRLDVWGAGSNNRESTSSRKNFDENKNSVSANYELSMKRTASLARGEATLGPFNFPEEADAQNIIAVLNQNGGEERDLGRYSLQVAAVAKGFAGATLELSAQAGITFDDKGLNITGTEWASRDAEVAKVKVFGGASLGMKLNSRLRWKPPEDLTRQLPQLADRDWLSLAVQGSSFDKWQTLGTVVVGGDVNAGYGGELGMRLGIKNGKFVAYFRAQVVIGLGAKGQLGVELDLKQLNIWFMMLSQALRDNDYGFVEWIDKEAFDLYRKLAYVGTTTLLDIGLLAARDFDTVNRLYDLMTQGDRAGLIADALVDTAGNLKLERELATWVQHLPPEALGPLLYTLTTSPSVWGYFSGRRGAAIDQQQRAIAQCLEWLEQGYTADGHFDRETASQLFERSVARMTQTGEVDNYSSWIVAYCANRELLDAFMEQTGENIPAAQDAREQYSQIASRLGRDPKQFSETVFDNGLKIRTTSADSR
ncbi:hypothetical protein [Vreelandella sp. EE27]